MELAGEVWPFWNTQNFGLGNLNRGKAETHTFSSSGVRHGQQAGTLVCQWGWVAPCTRWSPWTTSCSSWQWPQALKWESGYGHGGTGPRRTDSREWTSSQTAVCLAVPCSRRTDKNGVGSLGMVLGLSFWDFCVLWNWEAWSWGVPCFPIQCNNLLRTAFLPLSISVLCLYLAVGHRTPILFLKH